MILLAFDPGQTTGWATAVIEDVLAFDSGQDEFQEFMTRAWHFLQSNINVRVLGERFVITGGTLEKGRTDVNWSIETIGALRWMSAFLRPTHGHTFQLLGSSDAKKFASNDRLKALGWYRPGRGHANDAARVLSLALAELAVARAGTPWADQLFAKILPG